MEILISNNQDEVPLDESILAEAAARVLQHEGVPDNAELSIALVDEAHMQTLNMTYRGIDKPTDVLSFESSEEGDIDLGALPLLLGDIVICPAIARRQAEEYGTTFDDELRLLVTHGALHLLGYNHETDAEAEVMESLERKLLSQSPGKNGGFDSDEK